MEWGLPGSFRRPGPRSDLVGPRCQILAGTRSVLPKAPFSRCRSASGRFPGSAGPESIESGKHFGQGGTNSPSPLRALCPSQFRTSLREFQLNSQSPSCFLAVASYPQGAAFRRLQGGAAGPGIPKASYHERALEAPSPQRRLSEALPALNTATAVTGRPRALSKDGDHHSRSRPGRAAQIKDGGARLLRPPGSKMARGHVMGVWAASRRKREGPSRERRRERGWRRRSRRAAGRVTRLSPRRPPAPTPRRPPPLRGPREPGTRQPRCPRPGCSAGR